MQLGCLFKPFFLIGLISGIPGIGPSGFNVFPSEVISPRSFQMKQGDDSKDLLQAVDAAVVRTQIDGELLQAERDNPPFQVGIYTKKYLTMT